MTDAFKREASADGFKIVALLLDVDDCKGIEGDFEELDSLEGVRERKSDRKETGSLERSSCETCWVSTMSVLAVVY